MSGIRHPGRSVRAMIVSVSVAVVALTAFSPAQGASGTAGRAHPIAVPSSTASQYAINRRICPQSSKPHTMSCFAMERVPVAKGTPGAYRLSPRRGLASDARVSGCTGTDPIALGPAGGYTPADLAAAYKYNARIARPHQVVGIVDWYDNPNARRNLNSFDACYGLPTETGSSFRKVNQNGKTSPLPRRDANSGVEITLDIQSVRAVCHTCRILLVEAKGPADSDLAAAENRAVAMGATEISNSFGEPEGSVRPSVLAAYNHPGVVITASTGDDGWFGWDFANNKKGTSRSRANFPSTDPNVVAVGGTAILLNNNGSRSEEAVWNENGVDDNVGLNKAHSQGAGGGGCSKRYTAKAWQSAYPGYNAARCHGKRLAADISAIADPSTGLDIYDTFGQRGWMTVGGTSLASPVTAALFALAGGSGGAAYPSSSLYVNAHRSASSVFDVVPTSDGFASGNSFCGGDSTLNCGNFVYNNFGNQTHNPNALGGAIVDCSFPRNNTDPSGPPPRDSECNTVNGLDGPTGLGTPNSLQLFRSTAPTVSLAAPATAKRRASTSFKATAHERLSGIHVNSYAYTFGDGHSSTSGSPTAHHAFARAGTYNVTLKVTDSAHQVVIVRHKVRIS